MSDSHPIDHDTLAALREVMEDDFYHLIETYIGDSEQRLASMQKALAAGNGEEVRRAAHSFKGSCSNLGANGLVSRCQTIEDSAAKGELKGLEHLLVELQNEFNQVKNQLEIYQ
ncbi:Hpt domain-containing protein [Gilvimarinus algae]|uniref:Hpt domain-containing protein n=1 Tax=Gilvimarinus algae TaxID=3058037 RepID=A0ABT8TES4_9GAMM|nr:Hpt domain-containing protein [Gilvimarinus sp. SDUM040014]MDO3382589.1 Hpt domain-containing protein [Gilvimarinus sp. SDUM040014]